MAISAHFFNDPMSAGLGSSPGGGAVSAHPRVAAWLRAGWGDGELRQIASSRHPAALAFD